MKKFIYAAKAAVLAAAVLMLCGCGAENYSTVNSDCSLSNEKYGWGFKKVAGNRPELTEKQISDMEKYGCIYLDTENEKSIYLTFDEGYENGYTAQILDTLKKTGVHAAFFVTGPYLKEQGDLVKRMVDEGHTVGNHTVNHPSLPDKSDEKVREEISGLNDIFLEKFGINMKYFRPPMGEYSERTLKIASDMGYKNVFWSFAYRDWEKDNQKGAAHAYSEVTKYLHGGCVMLLHAVSKDNADALEDIIKYAQSMEYVFKTLDEYKGGNI